MNNKGFAITTVLYGLLILFCFLLMSLLGILATYRGNLEKLVNNTNGARGVVTMEPINDYSSLDDLKASDNPQRGLYCFSSIGQCVYVSKDDLE